MTWTHKQRRLSSDVVSCYEGRGKARGEKDHHGEKIRDKKRREKNQEDKSVFDSDGTLEI